MTRKSVRPKCCAYCGATGKLTRDHIPPKCLFGKPLPPDVITVPACHNCHAPLNCDDEYFKTVVSMRDDVRAHPVAQKILPSVFRAFTRPDKVRFTRDIFAVRKLREVVTPGGIYLGTQEAFRVNMRRAKAVTRRITSGLYFHETGRCLPRGCSVVSTGIAHPNRVLDDLLKQQPKIYLLLTSQPRKVIGDDVFSYRFFVVPTEPRSSIWELTFYGSISFLTISSPIVKPVPNVT